MRSLVATLLVLLLLFAPAGARANPKGGNILKGSGSIQHGVGRVDIHQLSKSATIDWDSFDIAPGEITQFHQPGSDAVAINRIFSGNASQILGSLQANGHVYLINPHGILFGREAQVNVHALIATTTVDGGDLAGGFAAQPMPGAQIINQGTITTGTGGFVYLIAPFARNGKDGVITSPEGQVMIEAGAKVYLTDRADGRGFAVEYSAPSGGEAVNLGKIVADGGFARLRGSLVTQGGLVQANAIREKDGVIELVAENELTLTDASVTRAAGGADAGSHAGTIDAWSEGSARVEEGAVVDVSAKAAGADGGFAEVSARDTVEVAGTFTAGAGAGGKKGEVLFDPEDIVIGGATKFSGAGKVTLAADREISVAEGAKIDLARQRGDGSRSGPQTLEIHSGGDVVFERDALIEDSGTGKVWNVDIAAGRQADGSRSTGGGDIVFEGGEGSGLRLARGNLRGVAADDVVLADGASMASIEGDVEVIAGGDVIFDAGRNPGIDTRIESGSGDVRVVAEGSVLLQRTPGTGGNAAIRTRGVYGTDGDGNVTKTDGGSVLVWAKNGDVDAGVGNRWLEPGPAFGPDTPGLPSNPDFDPMPVVDSHNNGPTNRGNRDDLSDGILGIGTEAGGDVVVIAGGDVSTRETPLARVGGTAVGAGTTYDGAHIGAFGVPVVYMTANGLDYTGAVALPNAPESRVVVLAGGDIDGDYAVRNGVVSLLAGYELPAGVDDVADLGSVGLDDPTGLTRDALRRSLEISALAAQGNARGWVGTLAKPVTVDLIDGSVDTLGRNGVAVRAIENPSLVYPPVDSRGTAKSPTYADDSFAILEAETGDVVLIGNEATVANGGLPNSLVWLLPPSLTIRTHASPGERAGDFVQLEDFLLFPSSKGGLTLDVAGKARTANGVASGSAIVTITASSFGAAADRAFTIPSGTLLRDPETGLLYRLSRDIVFDTRAPAEPATVRVTFEAEPGRENEEIVIPVGTRVEDYRGRIFVTTTEQRIPPIAARLSQGEVRFSLTGGQVTDPAGLTIPADTLLRTPSGALFRTTVGVNLNVGDRAVVLPVESVAGSAVVDARPGELSLVTPIAGISGATNRFATQRPASAEILFSAAVPGASDRSDYGKIKTLLTPIDGIRLAYGEAPPARGGNDLGTSGRLTSQPAAQAVVIGPVGNIRSPRTLELVDPSALPPGISARDLQIVASGTEGPAELVPAITKELSGDGRPDLPGDRINVADLGDVWIRTSGGSTATIRQSDADPGFDARNERNLFDYAAYYRSCKSGSACQMANPLDDEPTLRVGRGPTHQGDRDPASLHAGLGFERIGFELAEAARMIAGPGDDEDPTGEQADIVDVTLVTQHANAADVTTVSAAYGDILLAAESREVRDQQTGLTTLLPANFLSGFTVAGPGALVVTAGLRGEAGAATGVGGRIALSNVAIGDSSARGIETIGNLVNASLPVGGAAIRIAAAGNVELNDRGSIDTLQGGNIDILSTGGSLLGGEPDPSFTAKRGIFTLFVPGAGLPVAASGGGSISVDVAGDFDIGKSVTAALSGGNIRLFARSGSVSAGSATPFEILGVSSSPTSNLPEVNYRGGGIFASSGGVEIVAEEDVDIGAGITGASIAIAAGGNINAGQGAITSSGNVSIDAGGSISGTITASGAISIGSGSVSQSASLSAAGLVTGAGSAGAASNTGSGKVDAGTAMSADKGESNARGTAALEGGASRRSGVSIDVTSRPASGSDEDDEEDDEDEKNDQG
jgi:filamentous hemagglutinin family protein